MGHATPRPIFSLTRELTSPPSAFMGVGIHCANVRYFDSVNYLNFFNLANQSSHGFLFLVSFIKKIGPTPSVHPEPVEGRA